MTDESYLALNPEDSIEGKLKTFETNLESIRKDISLDNKDFQNDKLAFTAQRVILENLLVLLPSVVRRVLEKPGQGSVYALTNVIEHINELFGQLRSSEALENQVDYISNNIISIMLKELVMQIFDKTYFIKKELQQNQEFINNEKAYNIACKAIDDILKVIGKQVNEKQESAKEKLKEYLLEV